jgi:N6-L-threonylcarbamoyladenine synthase
MKILAIDTSCDETAAAVTNGGRVLSNIVYSQIAAHRPHGGVVPNIAKREHQKKLPLVIDDALAKAKVKIDQDIDAIAVTYGPGLAVALEVGIAAAKDLAQKHQKPLIAVDHMEGHLLSAFAQDDDGNFGIADPQFPALGLLVSGGHTELVLMRNFGNYQLVGQTLDDAAGEAFDKVARMLGLPYPGGPEIARRAERGDENVIALPLPMRNSGDLNFSFSGLKTACLYRIREENNPTEKFVADFAASFQKTIIEALMLKLDAAVRKYQPKMILLGGGVIANKKLQTAVRQRFPGTVPVFAPYDNKLLLDNAAMIGIAAHFKSLRNEFVKDINSLDRVPRLTIG